MSECKRAGVAILFFVVLSFPISVFAQAETTARTVLVAFDRSVACLGNAEYSDAVAFASIAEQSDPLLADPCYVKALAGVGSGAIKADIIKNLENAFVRPHWIYYNAMAARGLYALLLCDTGRFDEALATAPTDTADGMLAIVRAQYAKKRSYDARSSLSAALERFPFDTRFCSVFFDNESATTYSPSDSALIALYDTVFSRIDLFDTSNPELCMKAVPFLRDKEKASRVVAACRAAGYCGIDSTYFALFYGLIDDTSAAFELITAASKPEGITFSLLQKILPLMQSPDTIHTVTSWLYLFEGTVTDIVNGDIPGNLTVTFSRGRPAVITFDKNCDGLSDFVVHCDNGTPETAELRNVDGHSALFSYGTYPYITKATVGNEEYLFSPRALSWSPITINHIALHPLKMTFYMPAPSDTDSLFRSTLVRSCSIIRHPVDERLRAVEQLEMVDGRPYSSVRSVDGMPYALGKYRDGYLETRSVDIDGDGSFEATEVYAWNPGDAQSHLTQFYIDRNRNRNPEYSERYGEFTVYSWDTNDDGVADIEYRVMQDGRTITFYRHPITNQSIEIITYGNEPLSVSVNGVNTPILRGAENGFYWIRALPAAPGDELSALESKIRAAYSETSSDPNVCIISVDGRRYSASFSGGLFFAEMQE